VPLSAAEGKDITTIEGLGQDNSNPVQQAWIEHQVPQCGYCQPGMIMTAAAVLKKNPAATDEDLERALQGHICRCGTYPRIREAIATARVKTVQTQTK
jgi:isoquinoline 1-oxidoreductase alpha subunit